MCRISYNHYFCILNHAFDDDTQTRMKMNELALRVKQVMWMVKEKRKSIKALAKTGHGEIKSLETTSNKQQPDRLRKQQ